MRTKQSLLKKKYFWFLRFHLLSSYPLPKKQFLKNFYIQKFWTFNAIYEFISNKNKDILVCMFSYKLEVLNKHQKSRYNCLFLKLVLKRALNLEVYLCIFWIWVSNEHTGNLEYYLESEPKTLKVKICRYTSISVNHWLLVIFIVFFYFSISTYIIIYDRWS